jgi:hypothetical protein
VALQQLEHAAYSTQDEITQQFPDNEDLGNEEPSTTAFPRVTLPLCDTRLSQT